MHLINFVRLFFNQQTIEMKRSCRILQNRKGIATKVSQKFVVQKSTLNYRSRRLRIKLTHNISGVRN